MDRAIAHELLAALGFDAARQTPELVRLVLDEARKAKHALTTEDEVQADRAGARGGHDHARALRGAHSPAARAHRRRRAGARSRTRASRRRSSTASSSSAERRASRRSAATSRSSSKKEPLADIDPDQVVALGAAVQADLAGGRGTERRGAPARRHPAVARHRGRRRRGRQDPAPQLDHPIVGARDVHDAGRPPDRLRDPRPAGRARDGGRQPEPRPLHAQGHPADAGGDGAARGDLRRRRRRSPAACTRRS